MGLDLVEMVMDVETEFAVKLPDAELATARTVGSFYGVLVAHLPLAERPLSAVPKGPTWEKMLDVIARSTGIEREALRPDADFYRDLRLD